MLASTPSRPFPLGRLSDDALMAAIAGHVAEAQNRPAIAGALRQLLAEQMDEVYFAELLRSGLTPEEVAEASTRLRTADDLIAKFPKFGGRAASSGEGRP